MLKIATCQFAVTGDVDHNAGHIESFVRQAGEEGADLVHLSECCLSGYAGVDHETLEGFDWEHLRDRTRAIMELAKEKQVWVALGSMHELSAGNKPHNCMYLIGPDGKIHDRYDKRFCTEIELPFYTPGDRAVTFELKGVTCALLICFDLRFPEIYRDLYKRGVQFVIQSFYNARQKGPSVHTDIMRQTMQCRAATNFFWISMNNSSAWYSPYPSCFIRPDGKIVKELEWHRDQMMINEVNTDIELYDPMKDFRDIAVAGNLTNGPETIDDPRSKNVTEL
ncbi:(R)-stereoselective amidase [Anaerohalosphaera lusitana]|uniref:(R)-stereoselective amidase n=1 Tax=Anaerohalosphaera lusitana TaxID=1936003 RepID=A0A1U9NIX1_9BACT|nr:carbon-nitrogen hydrolase family protein [Anaerohalosphaera lusitana]AQT67456.1 (R)-stereoselective amidase [Anaerohalosphaera lusitana]